VLTMLITRSGRENNLATPLTELGTWLEYIT